MKTKTLVLATCAAGIIISGGVYLTQHSSTGALEAPDPVPEVVAPEPVVPELTSVLEPEPIVTVTVLSGDILDSEADTSTPIEGVTSTPIIE